MSPCAKCAFTADAETEIVSPSWQIATLGGGRTGVAGSLASCAVVDTKLASSLASDKRSRPALTVNDMIGVTNIANATIETGRTCPLTDLPIRNLKYCFPFNYPPRTLCGRLFGVNDINRKNLSDGLLDTGVAATPAACPASAAVPSSSRTTPRLACARTPHTIPTVYSKATLTGVPISPRHVNVQHWVQWSTSGFSR